jgi:molybdate transport system ATP-binding protein
MSGSTGATCEGGLEAHVVASRGRGFRLDVELAMAPGRSVALLGPNGSGKSTLVSALAGLLPLDGGRISLGARVLDDPGRGIFVPPEARRIGVVFQDYVLFPHLSAIENIAFGLRSRGETRAGALDAAEDWMRRLELDGLQHRKPGDLSGGQAQRVALARALITEPDLLLLDEPLAALDVTTRVRLRRTLVDHLEHFPGPRLLITHDPTEAFLLADEIYVLEQGVITQVGSADDIRLRPRTSYIADLAGSNLFVGQAERGIVRIHGHGAEPASERDPSRGPHHDLHVADTRITGPVLATVHPRAIALHRQRPDGSPRNTWQTRVARVEHYGDRVRLQVGQPLPLVVEVTPDALRELDLATGSEVWVSIKATEIRVET